MGWEEYMRLSFYDRDQMIEWMKAQKEYEKQKYEELKNSL